MIWILACAAAVTLFWLLSKAAKPILYRGKSQADFPLFLRALISNMEIGSVLHIKHDGSDRVMTFRKLHHADHQDGLRFELPDHPDIKVYHDSLRDRLVAAGFACVAQRKFREDWPAQDAVLLTVDTLSVLDAFRVAEVVREAMDLPLEATFTLHLLGMPSVAATRAYLAAHSS